MKMILGAGTISNYASYINGCTKKQWPYKIPITSLADVQLYISIGAVAPGTATYELIHTCGNINQIDAIIPGNYVIGQDTNSNYYGVFKNFSGSSAKCFVIAITLDSQIYFSEQYCIENTCEQLTLLNGCYGNLDPLVSYDRNGIYFGESQGGTVGDATVVYEHKSYMRDVEVTLNALKTTFKQGRTRTFRIEAEDILLFWAELVPEWYIKYIDAIFKRGEVYVGDTRYMLEATAYTKTDECFKAWKPTVTLRESYYQSFSCDVDPCAGPQAECCDPDGLEATVEFTQSECCSPEIVAADIVFE